ncbi:MAG: tyrosine-protein phosphatase [Gemmataceae bacterium]
MPPLVDIHVHLLAGLDDGPKTPEDALSMCRMMAGEGIGHTVACAHQNDDYPNNTPDVIRSATAKLAEGVKSLDLPVTVYPCAEVMVSPELLDRLKSGELMTVADNRKYILLEMPHGLCVELQWMVEELVQRGVRPILGHAERSEELLHDPGKIEALISAGCLVQVSSKSITHPATREDAAAIKSWFRRRIVHVLGSDGHSLRRRPPVMADAFRQVQKWVGDAEATRVGSENGLAILAGKRITVPAPEPANRKWFSWLFGG